MTNETKKAKPAFSKKRRVDFLAGYSAKSTRVLRERDIERYLKARVEACGGEVRKLKWVGRAHGPDRFVALNGAHLVELKRPRGKLRNGQSREALRLIAQGVNVYTINSKLSVDNFIQDLTI